MREGRVGSLGLVEANYFIKDGFRFLFYGFDSMKVHQPLEGASWCPTCHGHLAVGTESILV